MEGVEESVQVDTAELDTTPEGNLLQNGSTEAQATEGGLKPFLCLRLFPIWDSGIGMISLPGMWFRICRTRLHDLGWALHKLCKF